MISRLTRILLALVTAFVFTGQMEAAAQHCAKLAQTAAHEAAAIVAVAEQAEPPCHEAQTAADIHAAMGHASSKTNTHSDHAKSPPHCECIAALTGWIDLAGAATSTHAEAYAWLSPVETTFASAKTDPDLRPPRA